MSKDFKVIRESIDSFKKLGLPEPIILLLESWLEDELTKDRIAKCDHEWIDATNEVVSGTAYCPKCGALESLSNVTIREVKHG